MINNPYFILESNNHVVFSCLADKAEFSLHPSVFTSYFILVSKEHHLWSYLMSLRVECPASV